MHILFVTYEVKEGKREEFLKALSDLQVAEKTRREPGNLDYSYFIPVDGSNRIFLREVWESREAQGEHIKSEHIRKVGEIKDMYVDSTELKRFEAEAVS